MWHIKIRFKNYLNESGENKNEMMKLAIDIQLNGDVALTPVFPVDDKKYNKEELDNLSNAHRKKIELSDEILVVDVNGYIGESTKNEIDYACKLNKK